MINDISQIPKTTGMVFCKHEQWQMRTFLTDFRIFGHNVMATAWGLWGQRLTVIYDPDDDLWHVVPIDPMNTEAN